MSNDSVIGAQAAPDLEDGNHLDGFAVGASEPRNGTYDRWVEERGFTLAAMMVIMAVMAIFLTVAVETASFQTRREKEDELIFRGGQAVEAIRLFKGRNGRYPMTLGELITAKPRVLRKAWTDPMTGKTDWIPVFLGEGVTIGGPGARPGPAPTPGIGQSPTPTPGPGTPGQPGTGAVGPIVGVRSRVCDDSIKIWNGHTNYCDWKFVFDPTHPFGPVLQPVPIPNPTVPK
jgi:type II secretory pathway pseudopilin PulG